MSTLKRSYFTLEIFRKHYCPFCGNKLEKKKKITMLYKGDKGFTKDHLGVGYNPFVDENEITTYYFECNVCNINFSEMDVNRIRQLQKKEKNKILTKYTKEWIRKSIKRILFYNISPNV